MMTHLHILGLGGTFMSALAVLAQEAGFKVTGSDANCYPPVSDLLAAKGIEWIEGYEVSEVALKADRVIIGNAIKRGMPLLEAILEQRADYISGPQWLAENILTRYKVIAVAGTHGKTTTTAMLAWILHHAGMNPGFLIGGVAANFNTSASFGSGQWFVIEADEYDSAFFDKRPKFMHYRPQIAIINNLEFDHADIYADLAAIQQQFHYFMRTIPPSGLLIKPRDDQALNQVLKKGRYCRIEECVSDSTEAEWSAQLMDVAGQSFSVFHHGKKVTEINWSLIGRFNVENALAAIAASACAGVAPERAARALESYTPVKRRLEIKATCRGITVYDDFAHHPTAITKTIEALKASKRHRRILLVLEFASYTMRTGIHAADTVKVFALVDRAFILRPAEFSFAESIQDLSNSYLLSSTDEITEAVCKEAEEGDAVLIMSNRGFDHIHQKISQKLSDQMAD
ncbi:UDP-N-acetylmuramate:L-alanyl-gamma-D-glutamyl-meso-diaminopimelate ligase [Legionella israelensis]|nr:UDP-N-acetylmuramate:L-alanyl-gamma-D-glutamyl-meso-diaminopimelate ligase [Legionella israelensis]